MRARRPFQSAAFTLVEMLVVIVIIAILAGLLLPAVNRVRINAMNARIAVEIKNMERGFEAYKEKYGDYPPDFTDRDIVRRHMDTAWPNMARAEFVRVERVFWIHPNASPGTPEFHLTRVDPAEALVFWLGGFSTNPKEPFTGQRGPFLKNPAGTIVGANPDREIGTFSFDKSRLTLADDRDPFPVYPPPQKREPYVYFDSRTYGGLSGLTPPDLNGYYALPGKGAAKPYLSSRPSASSPYGFEWVNKDTFQIISAGLDGHYGSDLFLADHMSYPRYPEGVNYLSPGDGDDGNITNFSEGKTLKDMKP